MPPSLRRLLLAGLATAALSGAAAAQDSVPALVPVIGRHVSESGGGDIGRIWDILFDAQGLPRAAIIEYGGMVGLGRRRVAVPWTALHIPPGEVHQPATLDLTQEQLGDLPEYHYGEADSETGH